MLTLEDCAAMDRHIAKVLREIGNPEPPLDLALVRQAIKLDMGYYQSDNEGVLSTLCHRIKVAGLQVFQRPTLVADVIRNLELRALYLPDRRRILIDQAVPKAKHRWLEAHEISHDLFPWHQDVMLGDNEHTVLPSCHEDIESESNYGAGRLLFLMDRFAEDARSLPIGFNSIRQLSTRYGNSLTSTLWRYVELAFPNTPMVGIIGAHPHPTWASLGTDTKHLCRHVVGSANFNAVFKPSNEYLLSVIQGYCQSARGGPLGSGTAVLDDISGGLHEFLFETFSNTHDALTLGYKC